MFSFRGIVSGFRFIQFPFFTSSYHDGEQPSTLTNSAKLTQEDCLTSVDMSPKPTHVLIQLEQRKKYRIHTSFGGTNQGARASHRTQTRSELVVKRVKAPPRNPRGDFPLERLSQDKLQPVGEEIPQLPVGLPSLVRGRLAYPRALGFLGQQLARLEKTVPSTHNDPAGSCALRRGPWMGHT